ncbi:hypothetical protein JAAARDRAFT_193248 [Jaapia argillacea MUCL 33604]|uniref:DUF6533 domain-containing protein n=1 Tax=Jaapia argillacea MUCL 33604 TaxID=933084 RepID=A0A067Q5E6_9AGAM|nr:hypothetical protein JAAARDRAFT_193248 [Jaapia argillacea MUCL 33604]
MSSINTVDQFDAVRFCQVATTCVALYDHLITIDQEVDLIWARRWSPPKTLFIINRYLGELVLLVNVSYFSNQEMSNQGYVNPAKKTQKLTNTLSGKAVILFQAWGNSIAFWATQIIMQTRIYAMYGQSRRVAYFLGTCFIVEVIIMATIMIFVNVRTTVVPETISEYVQCTLQNMPDFYFAMWVPICAFESILFLFATWKGVSYLMTLGKWSGKSLMHVLVRDNILYFLLILLSCLANMVVLLVFTAKWLEIPSTFSTAIVCIIGSRLMFNMRAASYRPHYAGQGFESFSGIRFASAPQNRLGSLLHTSISSTVGPYSYSEEPIPREMEAGFG